MIAPAAAPPGISDEAIEAISVWLLSIVRNEGAQTEGQTEVVEQST